MNLRKVVAVIVGMLSGTLVHFLSRGLGLEYTLPGSLWACATATVFVCAANELRNEYFGLRRRLRE